MADLSRAESGDTLRNDRTIPPAEDFDGGDANSVKARNRELRVSKRDLDEVTRELMSSRKGRAWMADLIGFCGIGRTPFSADPLSMSLNCGMQNVGLKLQADLMRVTPAEYIKLLEEQNG